MAEILGSISELFYNNNRYSSRIKREKRKKNYRVYASTLLISFLYYYALEICNKNWLFNGAVFTFVNIFLIYSLIYLLSTVFVKRWIASIVCGGVTTTVSVINFYTVMYRNKPVSPLDIQNAQTAFNVLGSYEFGFHFTVLASLVLYAAGILTAVFLLRKYEKEKEQGVREYIIRLGAALGLSAVLLYLVFFAGFSLKPKHTLVWSWEETYKKYGFLCVSEEMWESSLNLVKKPYGYDEEALKSAFSENDDKESGKAKKERTPDIILIMNETFFDLSNVTEIETDKSVTPFIDSLKNKVTGYSIVPGSGGGTNRSEYELLTSNSLTLMPDVTPFAFLELDGADSIVKFLKEKGYETAASHCAGDVNYARGIAYPKLGFDNSYFIGSFGDFEKYGERPYATDKYVYEHMIEKYNSMGDGPRFFFNLTIQNHGDWDLNDENEDLIHTTSDFGEYTDDINEYLSCISLSDSAFEYLVNYYKKCDRDVIICMVGDHSPVFTPEIATIDVNDSFEYLKLYATPYVMWANFDIEDGDLGYTSMPYIVPLMLKYAGVAPSEYYAFMINMYDKFPAVMSNNHYMTAEKEVVYYDNSKIAPEIKTYFDLVYNRIGKDANRIDEIHSSQRQNKEKNSK